MLQRYFCTLFPPFRAKCAGRWGKFRLYERRRVWYTFSIVQCKRDASTRETHPGLTGFLPAAASGTLLSRRARTGAASMQTAARTVRRRKKESSAGVFPQRRPTAHPAKQGRYAAGVCAEEGSVCVRSFVPPSLSLPHFVLAVCSYIPTTLQRSILWLIN